MKAHGLPKAQRLSRRNDFKRAFEKGVRRGDEVLTVIAAANDLAYSRIGLIVSRKCGGAVRRNRVKRILRESFRLNKARMPAGLDLLLLPRPGTDSMPMAELSERLVSLVQKCAAARKMSPGDQHRRGTGSEA